MPSKDTPKVYKRKTEVDIRTLSFSDLYAMYQLALLDNNHIRGEKGIAVVSKRFGEIVEELNQRTYGLDPYALDRVPIVGKAPEEIDLTIFDEQDKNEEE